MNLDAIFLQQLLSSVVMSLDNPAEKVVLLTAEIAHGVNGVIIQCTETPGVLFIQSSSSFNRLTLAELSENERRRLVRIIARNGGLFKQNAAST